jgi:hypothetical protein
LPGAKGIEVANRGAGAAGPELRIKVGTTVGAATHGPVAATGDLAAGLVQMSGHGYCLLTL